MRQDLELSSVIKQKGLIKICRTFHPTTEYYLRMLTGHKPRWTMKQTSTNEKDLNHVGYDL